jgi:hypothetical protein
VRDHRDDDVRREAEDDCRGAEDADADEQPATGVSLELRAAAMR